MSAPQVLDYSGSMANSDNIVGALIVTLGVIAMSEVARMVRYINILFRLWLLAAPFIFQL
ncbi:MAG: SPW repeat domain-containing protein [Bacteroidota bacterium]